VLLSVIVASVGYGMSIAGAILLYWNAPLYIGLGQLPVLKAGESTEYFSKQQAELMRRQGGARRGLFLLIVGSVGQLIDLWLSASGR
jgi:hypothetical protein